MSEDKIVKNVESEKTHNMPFHLSSAQPLIDTNAHINTNAQVFELDQEAETLRLDQDKKFRSGFEQFMKTLKE